VVVRTHQKAAIGKISTMKATTDEPAPILRDGSPKKHKKYKVEGEATIKALPGKLALSVTSKAFTKVRI
jgi:hypothetical protein